MNRISLNLAIAAGLFLASLDAFAEPAQEHQASAELEAPAAPAFQPAPLPAPSAASKQPVARRADAVLHGGLTEMVAKIVSKDKAVGYFPRVTAVHKLSMQLSGADQEALFKLLSEHHDGRWNFMTNLQFNAIKNEAVIALARQRNADLVQELSQRMMDMIADKSYDDVWRNYCGQFMGIFYSRMSQEQQERCVKLLREASGEAKTCIPGTAFIALKHISTLDAKAVDRNELAKEAFAAFSSPEATDVNMISELQICAELGHSPALDAARKLAQEKNASLSLKASAIAAVGLLGNASDKAMLEPLSKSSDTRISRAASAALKRLEPR